MKKILLFLIAISIITACKNTVKNKDIDNSIKPSAGGRTGEIIVVIDDVLWNSAVGDSIFYYLAEPFYGLPQDEPIFKVSHVPSVGFKNIFKTNRNVLIINIKKDLTKNISLKRDLWANGQLVIEINAPDTSTFKKLWTKNKKNIRTAFFNEEIKRYQQAFAKMPNKDLQKKIQNIYGINLTIPNEYKLVEQKGNFLWFSRDRAISTQAVFIYKQPFTSSYQLSEDSLILLWEKLLYKNVPGPKEGTFPAIEKKYPIKLETIQLDETNGILLRGLWKTEGGFFLGGPFISITIVRDKTNELISLFSIIYGGKKEKKLYLWQVEAIFKSIKLTQ